MEDVRLIESQLEAGDSARSLDLLILHYQSAGDLGLLFEAKLMKKRLELGLPLLREDTLSNPGGEASEAYQQSMIAIAREVGELALERHDIAGAWRYYRAIGEPAPVAGAIELLSEEEGSDALIDIAFQQGANPAKGLAFIIAQHGMCRAITAFGMYAVERGRAECIALLVKKLHAEIVERIARTIESQEGTKPASKNISELIKDRDWLFGEYDTYVDTSHLFSLLGYATDIDDREILELYRQLCDYGAHLSSMFQTRGQSPFENPFVDYGHFVRARLGLNPEDHIQHFRNKLDESDAEEAGTAPAELLVNLLVESERYEEALEVAKRSLSEATYELTCPSILRLCQMAGKYSEMKELARERGDYLTYVAATALEREHSQTSELVR